MTGRLGDTETWVSAALAFDGGGAGDIATFTPGRPIEIVRWGYVWNSGTTTAPENLDLDLDRRVTIGSDTGRVRESTIAGIAAQAQGDGAYTAAPVTGRDFPILVDADEEVIIQEVNGATAGDGYAFIEYQSKAFVGTQSPGIGDLVDADA